MDKPVAGVTVALSRHGARQRVASTGTDGAGHFSFSALTDGLYVVTASKPSYVTTEYGARRAGMPGTPIEVDARDEPRELVVRMARGGIIAGTIRRPDRTAFGGVTVEVLAQRISVSAVSSWLVIASARADDRGSFRAASLSPGNYVVRVRPLAGSVISPAPRDGAAEPVSQVHGYVATYYPSATRVDEASTISLTADALAENVDINVQQMPFARVDGRVSTGLGAAVLAGCDVILKRADAADDPPIAAATSGQTFRFRAVGPGNYVLAATCGERIGDARELVTTRALSIAGSDVTDLNLFPHDPPTVNGRLIVDGAKPPAAPLAMMLVPVDPALNLLPARLALVNADGVFSAIASVAGKHRLRVAPQPASASTARRWFVTSVQLDGRSLNEDEIDVPEDGAVRGLTVSVTDRLGTISATVSDRAGTPRPEYTVIVFPQAAGLWPALGRRIFAARPTDKGRVRLEDVPPGEYRIAVVDDPEPNHWLLPSFLEGLVAGSIPLTVGPEAVSSIRLVVGGL
jgi:hypothetical protein